MTDPTADGIVFRTDADLRPEGRSGRSSRSSTATRRTTSGWAQTWEFQALLKARPVAGDADLGDRFMELDAAATCGPSVLDPTRCARSAR